MATITDGANFNPFSFEMPQRLKFTGNVMADALLAPYLESTSEVSNVLAPYLATASASSTQASTGNAMVDALLASARATKPGGSGSTTSSGQVGGSGSGVEQSTGAGAGGANFNIPTDAYPKSGNKSTSSYSSYSGINWSGPVASQTIGPIRDQIDALAQLLPNAQATLTPQVNAYAQQMGNMSQGLLDQVANLIHHGLASLGGSILSGAGAVEQAGSLADQLNRAARYAIRQAVQSPAGLQGLLNSLAARNMLSSSVASDAISALTREGLRQASQAAYQAAGQGAQAQIDALQRLAQIQQGAAQGITGLGQMQTGATTAAGELQGDAMRSQIAVQQLLGELAKISPAALATFAQLDKEAKSRAESGSSGYSIDPLAPYELMVQLFGLMM